MPGRPEQEEAAGHTHEEGRGRAIEDRGFFMELAGILALDVLGECPGLNFLKQMYTKMKGRFTVSKQCDKDITASDLEFKGSGRREGRRSRFVRASDGLGGGTRGDGGTPS